MLSIVAPQPPSRTGEGLDIFRKLQDDGKMISRATPLLLSLLLGGCSYFGIETEADVATKKEANNKAVGAGCRYSNRSIEQCYERNPKASKAGAFQGWKEMDAYMRENKMSGVAPDNANPTEKVTP